MCRAGYAGRLKRGIEMGVNDLERRGIGVVDADLLCTQSMLEKVVFDAVERERAGGIEAQSLQIACQHFHRRNAAFLDGRYEVRARCERKVFAAP